MNLNKNLFNIITQYRDISDSVIISYPITGIKSPAGSIVAFVDLREFGIEEFEEFGLIKVKDVVDIINIFDKEAELTIENLVINIANSVDTFKYISTEIGVLEETYRTSIAMLEKTKQAECAIEFKLTSQELTRIKKLSSFGKAEHLIIKDGGGKVVLSTEQPDQKNSNGLSVTPSEGNVFVPATKISIGIDNFKKLPDDEYKVKVAKNGKAYITRFDSMTKPGVVINIATKAM